MNLEATGTGGPRAGSGPTVEFLMDLATRFYLMGESQIEIARSTGLDPSTVSRYLKRARAEGIVEIEIRRPHSLDEGLARDLTATFGLKRAVVVADGIERDEYRGVARAAAQYIDSRLANGVRLGLSWGRMLSAVIHSMSSGTVAELDISLLHGGVGSAGAGIQGHELARHLASLHPGSTVRYLHAPVLVDSPDIRDAMVRDGSIRSALEAIEGIEIALVGIGTLDESAPLIRYGHITNLDRRRLLNAGAVGDIATRFFTREGRPVQVLDDRLLAIGWDELARVPVVVAVASGLLKRDAILGALSTGCVDVLVTDEGTARQVLSVASEAV
ncbi:MAG: sugar-binding transcriptional regulator [Solirubrobacteraceae bacterium]